MGRACSTAPVAVRSSAPGEDGPDASFAGQLRTELGVHGLEDVAAAIERCATSVSSTAWRRVWFELHEDLVATLGITR